MSSSGLASGFRWSGISIIGRELPRTALTILIARFIGPENFGIAALATVFVNIAGLLLDQGFASALIQKKDLDPRLPGAVMAVNMATGTVLMLITVGVAPLWASIMHTPELKQLLLALAPSFFIRSAVATPKALLMRSMKFKAIALVDILSVTVGGLLGVIFALIYHNYWAVAVQFLAGDVVYLLTLNVIGAGLRPNFSLEKIKPILPFALRAFSAGLLGNAIARNIDNLLIGRFQGAQALAFYGLAYRMLLMPISLATVTVGSVLFPRFSQLDPGDPALEAESMKATRSLALLAFPIMALVAAAAPQLVILCFGEAWRPAVPIIQVLAFAGAVQTVYLPTTTALVLGVGRATLNLRYAWLSSILMVAGIVAGLPFGPLGVAIGYSTATALTIPVQWYIRTLILGTPARSQLGQLLPAIHVALWAAATYWLVAFTVPAPDAAILALGMLAAAATGYLVLRMFHKPLLQETTRMALRILRPN